MAALREIADFLDTTLNIAAVPDYAAAVNGVQVANRGSISSVATAVDFSSAAVARTVESGAQLLVVHHGMFWGGVEPITGHRYERLAALIRHDVAVYSAHLPLDVHPTLGNNPLFAKYLGLTPASGFARYQTIDVGLSGESDIPTRVLADRAGKLARDFGGALVATPFAADRLTRRWGLCTGAGADTATLREAAARGIDTLIVGEGPQHSAVLAGELGIVVLYAGHYATETFGVRAVGESLSRQFGLTHTFLDLPTGL